jgi:hypothetical protein
MRVSSRSPYPVLSVDADRALNAKREPQARRADASDNHREMALRATYLLGKLIQGELF